MAAFPQTPGVTQKDLAKRLNLDQSTISRALHDDPRISKERRKHIRDTAKKLGYVPNPQASALVSYKRTSRTRPVGAELAWINIRPDARNQRVWKEFSGYWRGALATAETLGYRLEEFSVGAEISVARLQKILLARNIEGIVIAPHGGYQMDWQMFDWSLFSVVRLGRNPTAPVTHVVTSDQAANAMLAYQEMRDRGYKRIAFVGDPNPDRLFGAGYLWEQSRVPASEQVTPYYIAPRTHLDPISFRSWLKKNQPDAILMEDPRIPARLKADGWRIPKDIGLAGTTLLDTPASAGIDQNPTEIGHATICVLISLLQERASGLPLIPRTTLIKGKWIDGPSLPPRKEHKSPRGIEATALPYLKRGQTGI